MPMFNVVLIVLVIMLLCNPSLVLCALGHLPSVFVMSVKDVFLYFLHKKYNLCRTGRIVGFLGLFGRGKTLSAVHELAAIYRCSNAKRVYCPRRKKWVTQMVHIVSNVRFKDIPYEPLESLAQVVSATDKVREFDDANDTLTVTLVLIDEAGSELNSRAFRSNIDPLVLNSILTCRHWNISLYYTAQRFGHVDALLRQVTSYVFQCDKIWRFQTMKKYDAWELEQAANPANIRSIGASCWFVRNKDYNAYDTYSVVDKLKKDINEGNMMSAEEILQLRTGAAPANMDGVEFSRKYRKRMKRLY